MKRGENVVERETAHGHRVEAPGQIRHYGMICREHLGKPMKRMVENLTLAQVGGGFLGSGKHHGAAQPTLPEALDQLGQRRIEVLAVVDEALAGIQRAKLVKDGTLEVELDGCRCQLVLGREVVVNRPTLTWLARARKRMESAETPWVSAMRYASSRSSSREMTFEVM